MCHLNIPTWYMVETLCLAPLCEVCSVIHLSTTIVQLQRQGVLADTVYLFPFIRRKQGRLALGIETLLFASLQLLDAHLWCRQLLRRCVALLDDKVPHRTAHLEMGLVRLCLPLDGLTA